MFVQLKKAQVIVNTEAITRLWQSQDMERFFIDFSDGENLEICKADYEDLTRAFTRVNNREAS